MEADVVVAEVFMDKAREDVFAGMLLHQIKAALKVDLAVYDRARFEIRVNGVDDPVISAVNFKDFRLIQCACIVRLTAAFRVEGCGV